MSPWCLAWIPPYRQYLLQVPNQPRESPPSSLTTEFPMSSSAVPGTWKGPETLVIYEFLALGKGQFPLSDSLSVLGVCTPFRRGSLLLETFPTLESLSLAGRWWLTAIILATQEAEIRRIEVRRQPGQTVGEILF
jgi:hypothetical protein